MISFAEKPRNLMTDQPYGFGNATHATDHNYFHKYKDTYYLSRDQMYMTSKSAYGPFSNPRNTGQPGHTCFISFHGQWYHAWEFADDQYGVRTYRQVMMTYLHYKDNGDMLDDRFFLKVGTCAVPCTQGWDKYQLVPCDLKNAAGTVDLCLLFEGAGELMHLDWMTFRQMK